MIVFKGTIKPYNCSKIPVRVLEMVNAVAPKILGKADPNATELARLYNKITGRACSEAHFIMLGQKANEYIQYSQLPAEAEVKSIKTTSTEDFNDFLDNKTRWCRGCQELKKGVLNEYCEDCWEKSHSHSIGPSENTLNLCKNPKCRINVGSASNLFDEFCYDCHQDRLQKKLRDGEEIPDEETMQRMSEYGGWHKWPFNSPNHPQIPFALH